MGSGEQRNCSFEICFIHKTGLMFVSSSPQVTARERRRSGINLIEIALAQQYGQEGLTPDITSPENSLDPSGMASIASQLL